MLIFLCDCFGLVVGARFSICQLCFIILSLIIFLGFFILIMDQIKKSDTKVTPEKPPVNRQRSISETEIDLSSPEGERAKKKSKRKYLTLWSSKRSLDEEYLVLYLNFVWGFPNFTFIGRHPDFVNRQESTRSSGRKSKKGLVRLLSFGKSKRKYKNPEEKDSQGECLSEEVSLMEESFEALSKFLIGESERTNR